MLDLDGTLVDSAADIVAAERWAATQVGLPEPDRGWLEARLGAPLDELLSEALGATPAPARLQRFVTTFREHYYGAGYPNTRVLPGVTATLETLAPRYALAVVTTKPSRAAVALLQHCGLAGRFDHIQGTDVGLPHKPDPTLLRLVMRRLRCSADDAVMVGDTARDVRAGQAAGVHTVGFGWQPAGQAGLRAAAPDHWIDAFSELPSLLATVWG